MTVWQMRQYVESHIPFWALAVGSVVVFFIALLLIEESSK